MRQLGIQSLGEPLWVDSSSSRLFELAAHTFVRRSALRCSHSIARHTLCRPWTRIVSSTFTTAGWTTS